MLVIDQIHGLEPLYRYRLRGPYFFPADFESWKRSFLEDTDGEGRPLFRELTVKGAYDDGRLVGFVQYGSTAFGFDSRGELSSDVSYPVIRSLYFDEDRPDAGRLLLLAATDALPPAETVYAFFHYFGMSCYARHGKLYEGYAHIDSLLRRCGFVTEHENVYYSSRLEGCEGSDIRPVPHGLTGGGQQYFSFLLAGEQVGGCELHYVDRDTAYLRWIYVNDGLTGQGLGTKCMAALKRLLHDEGYRRFDTDTALQNTVAQHFYEKNGFTREGVTRSYLRAAEERL